MCKAIQDMIKDGEERGMERGIQNTIKICQNLGISLEMTLKQITTECSLTEDKAREYLQKYWI